MKVTSKTVNQSQTFNPITIQLTITIESLKEFIGIKKAVEVSDMYDTQAGEDFMDQLHCTLEEQLKL